MLRSMDGYSLQLEARQDCERKQETQSSAADTYKIVIPTIDSKAPT